MAFIPKKTGSSQKGPLLGGQASLMKLKGSFKGFSSARNSPLLGGEASLAKLRESFKKPPRAKEVKKEVKKVTSIFQPYATRERLRELLRKVEAWKITKLSAKERPKLERQLFNPKDPRNFGAYIDQREANIVLKDFENFPNRAKVRYGMKNRSETKRVRNLMRKLVGK